MESIDNLDILEVGDYIKVDETSQGSIFRRRRVFIGLVTKTNKEQLFVEIQFEFEFDRHNTINFNYHNKRELIIIPKTPRKIKKRKLKHKTQSHNKGVIIHKLSNKESSKIKNEEMLRELEEWC